MMRYFQRYFHRGTLILITALAISLSTFTINLIPQPSYVVRAAGPTNLPYVELQAENAAHNGTVIDATQNRTYPGLAVEAIGRRAVTLTGQGKFVEFTVPVTSNSIVMRYSIPDNAAGTGLTATLALYINGVKQPDLTVTSKYAYFYGLYPFNNNPGDIRGHHFYDEVHRLVGQMSAGTKVRVQVDAGNTAPSYTIDLMDFEQVAPALSQPAGSQSLSTVFGADPTGVNDAAQIFQNAVNTISQQSGVLWIPPGTFRISRQINIPNNVTIRGAGMWHSTLWFSTPSGNSVGLYGNRPSMNFNASDFAIFGEVQERNDGDAVNAFGGGFSNSTITRVWMEHVKVGAWLDGPFDRLTISNVIIRNTTADGVNFHQGVTNSTVTQSILRNTGDDALAMWTHGQNDSNNSFTFNRVEIPILANGLAIYGGQSNSITDNYVSDQQAEGGGIHVGNRFTSIPVSGTINVSRNVIVRAGSQDYYNSWNFGTGALWFFALEAPMEATINVEDNQIIDSNYEAIHFIGNFNMANITFNRNQIIGAGTYAIESRMTSGSVTFRNTTASGLGRGGYYQKPFNGDVCSPPSSFTIVDGGGNSGLNLASPICVFPYPAPVYAPVATNTPTPSNTPCPGGVCPPTNTPTRTATNTPTRTFTPSATPVSGTLIAAVNAGGAAVGSYGADSGFNQGNQFSDASTAIDTSGNLDPRVAPQGVYQTCRWFANFTYTQTGLTTGATYTVVLHWAELSFQAAGMRTFNVDINGSRVLTNFDVFATAGFKKALGRVFTTTANASGQIVIAFSAGTADNPFISGIEILQPGNVPTATRTNTPSVPTNTPTRTNTPVGPTLTPSRTNTRTNTPVSGGDGSPWNGTPAAIPGTVQAENYNTGGEGVAYHDNDTTNNGGQYRTTEGVDVEVTTDTGGGHNVGWASPGEWTKYTVNVATAGAYTVNFRVASGVATGAFALEVDGVNVTGTITVPNTGGWQTFQTVTRTGINLTAGQHVLRLVISGDGVNTNWLQFVGSGGATNTPTRTNTPTSNNGSPWNGTPVALPGTVQAENYNTGGQNVAYNDLEAANQGGQYRTTEGVDIEVTTDTGGGYNVGWTRTGEWMKYTVNATTAKAYSIDFRVANGTTTGAFYLEVDGVNVTGTITVPNTGGWQTWQTITRTGINLTAGQHVIRLVITGPDTNINWIRFN